MTKRAGARASAIGRSSTVILFATVLVDMMGFGIVLPLLPFYAESMGASPFEVTLLIASYSAMQLAAAPLWGRVSDRYGRRPFIVLGLAASAVSYLIFGLAATLTVLFVSRMTAGAAGGTISVAQAFMADSTEEEDRARGMGLIGAAAGLGVMLGPAIGGFFSQWGLGMPGYVAAGLCAVNAAGAYWLLPESRARPTGEELASADAATFGDWLHAMLDFPLSLLLGVYFLSITSFTAMTSVLALYMERAFGVGAPEMGVIFAIAGGSTVVVRGVLLGPVVRRFGEPATVRSGTALLALSLFAIPLLPSEWWVGLAVPLWALGTGTLFPSLASLVSRATDSASQGSILGGSQVVGGLGRVLGPIWAGALFEGLSITSPFFVGSGVVLAAAVLARRVPVARRKVEARPVPISASR